MIPDYWLEPMVKVYITVVLAVLTGGNPALGIKHNGDIDYFIEQGE